MDRSNGISRWLVVGAVCGGLAVALGAFGTHQLKDRLPQWYPDKHERQAQNWEIGVRYQMYHALALVGVGLLGLRCRNRWLHASGTCFLTGTIIFSGCLYGIVLTNWTMLGIIVAVGGMFLILGWALLAIAGLTNARCET